MANLQVGDHYRVVGVDQYGKPITLSGYVQGVSQVNVREGGKRTPMHAVQMAETKSGMGANWRGTVYTPLDAEAKPSAPAAPGAERGFDEPPTLDKSVVKSDTGGMNATTDHAQVIAAHIDALKTATSREEAQRYLDQLGDSDVTAIGRALKVRGNARETLRERIINETAGARNMRQQVAGNTEPVPTTTGYVKGNEVRPGMLVNAADLLPMHESQGNTSGENPNPRGHARWVRVGLIGNTNDPAYKSYNSNRSLTGGMYVVFDQSGHPVGRMSANTIAEANTEDVKPEAALVAVRMPIKIRNPKTGEVRDGYAQVMVPSAHAQQEQGLPAPKMLREGVLDPTDPNYGKGGSRPRGNEGLFGGHVQGNRTHEEAVAERARRRDVYASGEEERARRRAEEEAKRREERRIEREQEAKVAKAKQDARLEQYRRDGITRDHESLVNRLAEPDGETRAKEFFRLISDRGVKRHAEEYGVKTRGRGVTRETMIDGIVQAVKDGKQPDYEIHAPKPELTGDAAAEAEAKKIATADKRRRTSVMKNFDELKKAIHLDEVDPQTNWRGKPDRRADFHYGLMMSDMQISQLAEALGLDNLTGQALREAIFEAIRQGRVPNLDAHPVTALKKKR